MSAHALVREDDSPCHGAGSMFRELGLVLKGRSALRSARERARRQQVIAARQTDCLRWQNAASYNPSWATRLDSAMPLMAEALWVADLGCGMQDLRKRMAPAATYLPMDIKRWTDDTLVCDLNAQQLPELYISLCDVCVVMGVLEYLYEPDWLLARLAEYAEGIVLSYNASDRAKVDRPGNGWVNAFSADEILGMVERTPYRVTKVGRHGEQILVKAMRPDFDAACRERRDERRRAFRVERAIAAEPYPAPAFAIASADDPVVAAATHEPVEAIAPAAGGIP
jgi:hypothetical protein